MKFAWNKNGDFPMNNPWNNQMKLRMRLTIILFMKRMQLKPIEIMINQLKNLIEVSH